MSWTCEVCTFADNQAARSRCQMCDAPKPKVSAGPAARASPVQAAPARASPVQVGPAPAAAPAAARPAQPVRKVNDADVKALTDMGFARADVIAALEATGSKQRATDWLIQNGKAQSPPPVARTAPSVAKPVTTQPSKPAVAPVTSAPVAAKPAASAASIASAPRVGPSAAAPSAAAVPKNVPSTTATVSGARVISASAAGPPPALSPVPTFSYPPTAAAAASASVPAQKPVSSMAAHKPASNIQQPAIPAVPKQSLPLPGQSLPLPGSQPQMAKPFNAPSMASATPAPRAAGAPAPSGKAEAKFDEPPQKSEAEKEAERKARQEALEAHRLAKLEEEQKIKMERLKKDQEREEKRKAEEEERRLKRLAQEQQLKDIPTALKYIEENYEITRLRELCKVMCTIVRNIIKNPNEEKYRVINTKNPTIHRAITRPLGGLFILKQLGFTDKADAADHIILEKPNLKLLQTELKRFESYISRAATIVPQLLKAADQKHKPEDVYFAAEELRNIFGNVVAAGADDGYTNGKNFRTVDLESAAFQRRIKPINEAVQILSDFGYKPEHDTYLVVDNPDVSKFEAGFQDCTEELRARGGNTPVALAIRQLLKANNWSLILTFVEKMNAVLLRIINDPHETKYHRVKLEPFFAKLGVIDGGTQFFERFGFKLDPVANVAVMPYPESNGFDPDLLKRRYNDLNRVWKEEMAAAQQRRDAEAEAKLAQERAARVAAKSTSNSATPLPLTAAAATPMPTFASTGHPNVAALKAAPALSTAHTAVAQKGRPQGPSSITQTATGTSAASPPVAPVNKPAAKPTNPPQRK